jgi:Peroxiredoxin
MWQLRWQRCCSREEFVQRRLSLPKTPDCRSVASPLTSRSRGQDGKQVSLASLLKKGPVAVVFHRSADWCVYCKLQMVQLEGHLKEIEAAGGQVVAISYDPVEKLRNFADRSKITFPMLSDADSKTIDAYDVRSPNAPPKFSGISRHATFILDQSGVIRAKMFRLSYKERSAVDALINGLKEARTIKEASNIKPESTP